MPTKGEKEPQSFYWRAWLRPSIEISHIPPHLRSCLGKMAVSQDSYIIY